MNSETMRRTYPLTHFEELMVHQDCPAYPANCFLRLRFEGRLDRDAFQSATRLAVTRHPLLRAIVEKRGRRYHWQIEESSPDITWVDPAKDCEPAVQHLELESRHGLRLIVTRGADRSDVLIQFHHACCDGLGIYQFARELLIAYTSALPSGPELKLPDVDEALLKNRESFGLRFTELVKVVVRQTARLPNVWHFFRRTPPAMVPHQPRVREGTAPRAYPGLCSHHFDYELSSALRQSRADKATLLALLARDLFLAVRDFRRWQGNGGDAKWLRFMIPMNLRRKEQYRTPAANIMGAVFLERRGLDMRDPDRLLQGLRDEMSFIKRLQLGYLFLFALFAQRWLPGGLRNAAQPERCPVSAVFTNLGKVFTRCPLPHVGGKWQCGNVVLQSTETAAPIARNVCAAFAASWYANRLSITLHYDPGPMSASEGRQMLNFFVQRIQNSAFGRTQPNVARTDGQLNAGVAATSAQSPVG